MKKIPFTIAALVLATISQLASCQNNPSTTINNKTSNEINKEITNKKIKEMKTIQLTQKDFLTKIANYQNNSQEWKYLGDKPAIIDFYADWCGPCKMIAPILEELAEEYGDKIYVYKVNTEKERELATAFGIRSIPTLLFIPMGETPQIAQGALPKNELKRIIDEILLKSK
ncbi:thioredoxin [Odoribacter sp. OttesenSCG-928-L07]|nr:thioredoxin [Odoribacter sp. OttesenSCG-928-L07]MDL2238938.1 thioredoxin [Bacteroidales bacterium OttesenSCG-928-L14]